MKELFYVNFEDESDKKIRSRLLNAQLAIVKNNLPVVLVLGGLSGSGRTSAFNRMWSWMNNRDLLQNAYEHKADPNDTPYRRFWKDLPSAGKLGIYLSSWYTNPITDRAYRNMSSEDYEHKLEEINNFEQCLADNGYIVMKYWLDISKKHTEKYLQYLEEDIDLRWKIMDYDYDSFKHYDELQETLDDTIEKTNKEYAPWHKIKGETRDERVKAILNSFCDNIEAMVKNGVNYKPKTVKKSNIIPEVPKIDLGNIELEKKISRDDYNQELKTLRSELNELFRRAQAKDKKVILCFEGPDASGKGGVILRTTSALNPRLYNIFPISAPSEEEKKHHYLWRFWNRLSEQKLLSIFDRSWYGRVLVERLEKLTPDDKWLRGYNEINNFEKQLVDGGNIVIKFLLYISKDEQLERFEARKETEYKKWKITDEDWRNRDKWDEYDKAFSEMITLTDTGYAPWIVVATNSKKRARIKTMTAIKEILTKHLMEN